MYALQAWDPSTLRTPDSIVFEEMCHILRAGIVSKCLESARWSLAVASPGAVQQAASTTSTYLTALWTVMRHRVPVCPGWRLCPLSPEMMVTLHSDRLALVSLHASNAAFDMPAGLLIIANHLRCAVSELGGIWPLPRYIRIPPQ